jgi:hypothetical protein
MYRSIYHWHPLLNGYSSYWPADFPRRMALANLLPDPNALATLRRETGLAFILVRVQELWPTDRLKWLALAEPGARDDLRLVARDEIGLLFALTDAGAPSTEGDGR